MERRPPLCLIVGAEEGLSADALAAARAARPGGRAVCFDCDAAKSGEVDRVVRSVAERRWAPSMS